MLTCGTKCQFTLPFQQALRSFIEYWFLHGQMRAQNLLASNHIAKRCISALNNFTQSRTAVNDGLLRSATMKNCGVLTVEAHFGCFRSID